MALEYKDIEIRKEFVAKTQFLYAIFCYDFVTSFKAQVWEMQINRITYMKFLKNIFSKDVQ